MLYHRAKDVTWELADDRAVILDPRGSVLVTLNPVGTLIWRQLDAPRRTREVADELAAQFPAVDREQLCSDAQEFLDEMMTSGLVGATEE